MTLRQVPSGASAGHSERRSFPGKQGRNLPCLAGEVTEKGLLVMALGNELTALEDAEPVESVEAVGIGIDR